MPIKPFFSSPGARLSEGVTYNPQNNSLLWVDIAKAELHRLELPPNGQYTEANLNTIVNSHEVVKYQEEDEHVIPSIGALALTKDADIVVVAASLGLAKIDFKTLQFEYLHKYDFIPESRKLRYRSNDCNVSPAGNFYVGIMNTFNYETQFEGYLAKFDCKTKKFTILLEKVGISNGMVWSMDNKRFYHIDSMTYKIFVFDYDKETDTISNRRVFFDSLEHYDKTVELDGMTSDEDDNLYVALWGGYSVIKINPEGKIVDKYEFPAKRTDCPVFAGKDMNEMFVTTADINLDDVSNLGTVDGDFGGGLFRLKIEGVKGRLKGVLDL